MTRSLAAGLAARGHQPALLGAHRQALPQARPASAFWEQQAFDAIVLQGLTGAGPDLSALLADLPAACMRIGCLPAAADGSARAGSSHSPLMENLFRGLAGGALDALVLPNAEALLARWDGHPLPPSRLMLLPDLPDPAFFQAEPGMARVTDVQHQAWHLLCPQPSAADLALLGAILPALRQRYPLLRLEALSQHDDTDLAGPGLIASPLPASAELAQAFGRAHLVLLPSSAGAPSDAFAALAAGGRVLTAEPDPAAAGLISGLRHLARCVPLAEPLVYAEAFGRAVSEELEAWAQAPAEMQERLHQQAQHMARMLSWKDCLDGWEALLAQGRRPAAIQVTPRSLKWCFLDTNHLVYGPASPEHMPLGGSQAALCYLARVLAARGHRVSLVNSDSRPVDRLGVRHLHREALTADAWQREDFDLIVSLNEFKPLLELPAPGGDARRRVFWNQHNPHVPGVEELPGCVEQMTVVYISAWQQGVYRDFYGLAPGYIIPNACPPFYLPQPAHPDAFLAAHPGPLQLAYTSTPNRGLRILVALFPALRQLFPGLRLQVFSSLQVYQVPAGDEDNFRELYAECRQTEGIDYYGSVPQLQLAAALRRTHVLAYPNVYEETSCIAAMEAMAAGCQIVTAALGALPETTAGFATLVPFDFDNQVFGRQYFDTLCQALRRWYDEPLALTAELQAQSRYALQNYSWEIQASRWEELARRLMAEA